MSTDAYEIKDGVLDLGNDEITTIENKAFLSQRSIRTVILPAGIEHIGDWAFAKCANLKNVSFKGKHRPGLFGKNVFEGCDMLENIEFSVSDPDTGHLLAVCANKLPYDHLIRSDDVGQKSWFEKWDICLAAKLSSDNAEAGISAALCGEEDISYDGIGSVDGEMPGEPYDFLRKEEYKKCSLCYLRLQNDRYLSESTRATISSYIIDNSFGTEQGSSFYSIFDEGGDVLAKLEIYLDTVKPDKEALKLMTAAIPREEVYARSFLIRRTNSSDTFDTMML